jgi:hypothetical protein
MQALGPSGYTLYLGGIHLGIGIFALWRMTRRPSVAVEDRGPYIAVATPSPVVTPLTQALREEGRAERPDIEPETPVVAAG